MVRISKSIVLLTGAGVLAQKCRRAAAGDPAGQASGTLERIRGEEVVVVRSVIFTTLGLAAVLLAGCATTRTQTASAADGLERAADAFAARACYEPTCFTSQYLAAAYGFAEQAREFRQTLDVAGDQDVVFAYKRLWHSYHTLRDEVYRSRDPQLRADLKPTTQAFVIVQRNVKTGYSYADGSLYAGGAYTFNPYYN